MDVINVNAPVETVPYGKTVIPENRLRFLGMKCRETLERLPGNVLEIGVYRGGTLIELAKQVRDHCPRFRAYGVDTFTGHPYHDGHPVHPIGKYGDVDIAVLQEAFKKEGVDEHIVLYEGRIEEIFDSLKIDDLSFVHVDCDLYLPIKFCCETIAPLIRKGGCIYFDDYGHEHCPGATRAIDEVLGAERITKVALEDGTCWSGYIDL